MSDSKPVTPNTKPRDRFTIDLTPYPDVQRMLARVAQDRLGVPKVRLIMESLRRDLVAQGYGRKKDIVQA